MNAKWASLLLAGFLTLIVFALLFRLFLPFFQPISWAVILSLFLFPLNRFLRKKLHGRRGLSALILTISVVVFILIPVSFALTEVTAQALDLIRGGKSLLERGPEALIPSSEVHPRLHALVKVIIERLSPFENQVKQVLATVASNTGQFLFTQGKALFKNTVQLILNLVFMLVTLFYIFRDGDEFFEKVKGLLPTSPEETERIAGKVQEVLLAVLYGSILTGLIQGLAALFIYLVLRVPSPVLLGLFTAAASFVPIVGTALVWVPIVIYLLIKGAIFKALILLIYCALVVSQIDSIIRPFIVGSRTEIHNLFLFFSILGGLKTFGILGVFLGPIILSLSVSLIEIYRLKVLQRA
ncbi:AI-2E family transporter [Thermosulfurimonas dismutans]|uniref:Putative membrane protein n=1 Tax=Thermosulfurimonas dismutans TaxID=999894 RepID=A0A179D386_9BACT|nr:AI-2E family transporter [Thermosulfurimonas dismutans]OAQ20525.1 putative membrane protein [Thermosulfurimonas dismutans]